MTWTGWAGRRFDDLTPNVEVPVWAVSDYANQYGRPWKFTDPASSSCTKSGRLVALTEPDDVAADGVTLDFEPGRAAAYHARDEVPYHYWFDIVTPRPGTTTEARYHLALTDHGRLLLARRPHPPHLSGHPPTCRPARADLLFRRRFRRQPFRALVDSVSRRRGHRAGGRRPRSRV